MIDWMEYSFGCPRTSVMTMMGCGPADQKILERNIRSFIIGRIAKMRELHQACQRMSAEQIITGYRQNLGMSERDISRMLGYQPSWLNELKRHDNLECSRSMLIRSLDYSMQLAEKFLKEAA